MSLRERERVSEIRNRKGEAGRYREWEKVWRCLSEKKGKWDRQTDRQTDRQRIVFVSLSVRKREWIIEREKDTERKIHKERERERLDG